jgi:hypothetical protein
MGSLSSPAWVAIVAAVTLALVALGVGLGVGLVRRRRGPMRFDGAEAEAELDPLADPIEPHDTDEVRPDMPEVLEIDPLGEARILASYGRFAQALNLVRVRLSQHPRERAARRLMLEILLDLDDAEGYAATMRDWMAIEPELDEAFAASVANGLLRFPHNAELQAMAAALPGMGAGPVRALQFEAERAPEPPEPPEPTDPGAQIIPFPSDSGAREGAAETPPPPSPRVEIIPLVHYRPALDSLSAAEILVLRSFFSVEDLDELGLGVAACAATTDVLQWRLAEAPSVIKHYVDLIKRYHRQRNLTGYATMVWRVFWLLGDKAPDLRERLVQGGERLGTHPIIAGLRRREAGKVSLEDLAAELDLTPELPCTEGEQDLPLVVAAGLGGRSDQPDAADSIDTGGADVAGRAHDLAAQGHIEQAFALLETALLEDPTRDELYSPLVELQLQFPQPARFADFQRRILSADPQPSLESIMLMLDTGNRLLQARAAVT